MLVVLMVVYVGLAYWGTREDLTAALRVYPPGVLRAVIGLVCLGILLRIIRWQYYIRCLRWSVSIKESVLAFLAGFAFTATPGKAGEAIKSLLLNARRGVPISAGVGVLIVERLGDLIAVLLLAVVGFTGFTGTTQYLILAAVLVIGATLFFGIPRVHGVALKRLAQISRLRPIVDRVADSLRACHQLLRPAPSLIGVGIAVLSWGCEGLAFYCLTRGTGLDLSLQRAVSIYGMATLAGALSALPGGLGGFEVVMVLLLNHVGIGLSSSLSIVAVFRLCTLWFGILLGALSMLLWFLFTKQRIPTAQFDTEQDTI